MSILRGSPTLGVVLNTGTSQIARVPLLVDRLREELGKFKVKVVVSYGPEPLKRPADKYSSKFVHYLAAPCRQGAGVIAGFGIFLAGRSGDRRIDGATGGMMAERMMYSDSDHAPIFGMFPEIAAKIGEKGVLGRWRNDVHMCIPQSQFRSERSISYLVSLADPLTAPDVQLSWSSRRNFEAKLSKAGTLYSVYLGLAGIPGKAWEKASPNLGRLYSGCYQDLEWAGIDAGLILAVLDVGFRFDNSIALPKEYEHEDVPKPGSEGERKYAMSRVKHFQMEANVVKGALREMCPEKLLAANRFVDEMAGTNGSPGLIEQAGFHWPKRYIHSRRDAHGKSSFV